MNFMDFYINDPVESAYESAVYAGLVSFETDMAVEGFKDGVKNALTAIKEFFIRIGKWIQRRFMVLDAKLGMFANKKRFVKKIGKDGYKALKKMMPLIAKVTQEYGKISSMNYIYLTGAPGAENSITRKFNDNINDVMNILEMASTNDGEKITISDNEVKALQEWLKDLLKSVNKGVENAKKAVDKAEAMSDDDPNKEAAVKGARAQYNTATAEMKMVNKAAVIIDGIEITNIDITDADGNRV